jgi:predicted acyltransferase
VRHRGNRHALKGHEDWAFLEVASPAAASLAYAVTSLLAVYGIEWFMYRRRWFPRF